MKQIAIALALVGVGTIGLANTSHAMTLSAPSALKEAVPSNASPVFWRGGGWRGGGWGGGWGPGIGFGIAAGALTAAAVASTPYWGGGYWGAYPGYGGYPGYAYAPAYGYGGYAPAYAYGGYGPAYYGTTYVRPRLGYAYGRVGPRVRYAHTSAYGVRAYSSGPRYRATGSMRTARVAHRCR